MSTLYLATDPYALAAELTQSLEEGLRASDDLTPALVVVPNRALEQWLTFHLARALGVLINVRFLRLETALWECFREVDPREHAAQPEMLDGDRYQWLVLAVLLEEEAAALAPLKEYLQSAHGEAGSRQRCRRAWHLAGALGGLIRDYEYHRQDDFIQLWLKGRLAAGKSDERALQQAQQAIFQHIVQEPDGRRARLNRGTGRNFKTLPQYVKEVMELPPPRSPAARTLHIFGLTQISSLHIEALGWLSRSFDLRVYGLNPLAGRLAEPITQTTMQQLAERFSERRGVSPTCEHPARRAYASTLAETAGDELLSPWARAGAESLHLVSQLLKADGFEARRLPLAPGSADPTVLARLQEHLLGAASVNHERLPQDTSLQIVGCPGAVREVETVHNSILQNLHDDGSLRLSEIAVLVTDMARYRPALHAVFDRPPRLIPYSLIDFSAAGASAYGKGLVGMLDLALESFTRSGVFEVLHNPCFLARLGITPEDTRIWETWTDALGVHHGWDAAEKGAAGLPESALYSWRLALQRLRLGRCMQPAAEDQEGPAPRFGDVLPYADLESGDREQLALFCQVVEGLLTSLVRLRAFRGTGRDWAERLRALAHEFLDVPEDRPEEAEVRDRLLAAVGQLELWDHIAAEGLPPALVREFLHSRLEGLEARRGAYLTAGVTVAALQPMRPVPFRVLYVLGLNEQLFPGSNQLPTLDLRQQARRPGDIRPAEHQRFLFLEAILSARQKLYLFYNSLDSQRDQKLLPAVPVQQLQRWLGAHVTTEEFRSSEMPLYPHDAAYFDPAAQVPYQDVLVQHRPAERLAALDAAQRRGWIALDDPKVKADFEAQRRRLQPDFSLAEAAPAAAPPVVTLRLRDLERFLRNPAEAGLRRHLHIVEDFEAEDAADFEPLVTGNRAAARLCRQTLQHLAVRAGAGALDTALADWPQRFAQSYDDLRLRSRAPEAEFAVIDHECLRRQLHERIHGEHGLAGFLRARQHKTFCGPILIGESITPVGPRLRFPACTVRLPERGSRSAGASRPNDRTVRVVGHVPLAWYDAASFELLLINNAKSPEDKELGHLGCRHLQALLFYLMLLAETEANPDGISGRALLESRDAFVHLASRSSLETIQLPRGLIKSGEAETYLSQLAGDCLDAACFDHLPFMVLAGEAPLRPAYEASEEDAALAADYPTLVADAIEKQTGQPAGAWMVSELLHALKVCPPAQAYERTRRRFRLLDRPLALQRAAAPQRPAAKRAVKKKAGAGKKTRARPKPPPGELF